MTFVHERRIKQKRHFLPHLGRPMYTPHCSRNGHPTPAASRAPELGFCIMVRNPFSTKGTLLPAAEEKVVNELGKKLINPRETSALCDPGKDVKNIKKTRRWRKNLPVVTTHDRSRRSWDWPVQSPVKNTVVTARLFDTDATIRRKKARDTFMEFSVHVSGNANAYDPHDAC